MEMTLITEGPQKEFERFQLHAQAIRDVADFKGGKVGLSGFGAQAGELGTAKLNEVGFGVRIGKFFQYFGWLRWHYGISIVSLHQVQT